MRIGVIGPTVPDWFADNISFSLKQMGHHVEALGAAQPRGKSRAALGLARLSDISPMALEWWQRRLVRRARRTACEVVINVEGGLLPAAVESLRTDDIDVALWFPDCVANLGRQLMFVGPYSALFFKDPLLVERLQKTHVAPVYYLPEACNPAWHYPVDRAEVDPWLVVAGNLYPSRVRLLEQLYRARVPMKLFGSGWPRWLKGFEVQRLPVEAPIYRSAKARAFRRAAAVLNNLHPAEMQSVNCRLFEAAGCGAVILCDDRPVLGDFFDTDRELIPFSTVDELVDHARYALANPDATTVIGDAAARRAHSEHTYQARLTELLNVVALSKTTPRPGRALPQPTMSRARGSSRSPTARNPA